MSVQINLAVKDAVQSIRKFKLWLYLGWADIQLRYRGSVLGPFWITLSMAVFIMAFGFIYAHLLHQALDQYIPFVTCGILIWTYMATTLTDSCDVFYNAKDFICQIKLPYMIYIYRIVWRNGIVFFHNMIVYIIVACYFQIKPNLYTFLFIPGFLLLTINLIFLSLFIAILATRYRDIPPVINSVIQIIFFASPIAWMPYLLKDKAFIVEFNPVFYYLEIVRAPLLGQAPSLQAWVCCILMSLFIFILLFPCFVVNRSKIPYWL